MFAKIAIFGLLFTSFILGFNAQSLIEVDESIFDDTGFGGPDADRPFGETSSGGYDGNGINIVGPKNPNEAGEVLDNNVDTKDQGEDKVIDEPWRPFYDPNHKNDFGQTFPAPEDTDPKVPKRPGHNFPVPEGDQNNGHQSGSNGGFGIEFPEPPVTQSPSHGHNSNGGFEPVPIETEPPIDKYTTPKPIYRPTYPSTETEKPVYIPTTKKPTHGNGGIIDGILGWGKQTTKKPHYPSHSNENKLPGLGGGLGNIIGGIKDAFEENKDAVDKAVNSVKEAHDKIVEAGKDVVGAGWQIGQSIKGNKGHSGQKNYHENENNKIPLFPGFSGLFGSTRSFDFKPDVASNIFDEVYED